MISDLTEAIRLADACAKCGACTAVCPVYQVTGRESLTARGRLHLLSHLSTTPTRGFGSIFSACLLCGACAEVCPRKIDILSLIIRGRSDTPAYAQPHYPEKLLVRKTLASPSLLKTVSGLTVSFHTLLPENSGLRRKLTLLREAGMARPPAPAPIKDSSDLPCPTISYFSGCLARHLNPEIQRATDFLIRRLTGGRQVAPTHQVCCGLAAHAAGSIAEAQELARKNIVAFADHSLPILTSCASCYSHLRSYPALLADDPTWAERARAFAARVTEFSSFFLPHTAALPPTEAVVGPKIFYHDPCHLRFGPDRVTLPPRQLIATISGTDPISGSRCCGQGGLFHLAHPLLSRTIFSTALADFVRHDAGHIVTTCSGCLIQWRAGIGRADSAAEVLHLAVLLSRLMMQREKGADHSDPLFTTTTK